MSCVFGRLDRDWLYIPNAPAQPTEIVPVVPRSPPKTQSRKVPTLQKEVQYLGHIVTWGDNHRSREAESRMGMVNLEE
jgi:hypothetical protein